MSFANLREDKGTRTRLKNFLVIVLRGGLGGMAEGGGHGDNYDCPSWEARLTEESRIDPPEGDFGFPFTPYDIQRDFMKALFTALEGKKLGIFESPTGTGKSLSLLCGSLTWLESREEERLQHLKRLISSFDLASAEIEASKAEDWIVSQSLLRKKKEVIAKAVRELKFLEELREKRKKYLGKKVEIGMIKRPQWNSKDNKSSGNKRNEVKKVSGESSGGEDLDDLILSDDFAPEMNSDSEDESEDVDEEPEFYPFRIFFASRTHSQLSQFTNELKRTNFATKVTVASLGSRQTMCINPEVSKLKNMSLINERCLELQKLSHKGKSTSDAKKIKTCGCEFYNRSAVEDLKNTILSEPMDIEDLVTAGKELNACPYYASRKASKEAQMVMLPYNTILHSGTRETIGLKVNNSAVLLDEAHNLIESISNMYSNFVSLTQLEECFGGLELYISRYKSRFSAKNLLKLKQVRFVVKSLVNFLNTAGPSKLGSTIGNENAPDSQILSVQQFKVSVGIDNLDLFDLLKFIKQSKLGFKLKGYMLQKQKIDLKTAEELAKTASKSMSMKESDSSKPTDSPPTGPSKSKVGQSVMNFIEFSKSLLTLEGEGRIIVERKTLKFLLLNTADHFQEIIRAARTVILAGGTMKPYEEIEDMLFQCNKERILHFSCNHVIPNQNLVCLALGKGPTSVDFDFTFKNRKSTGLMDELSRTIINVSKIVPGGLVCFLPSYDYESQFFAHLQQTGSVEKIEAKKKIFREPKDSNCEKVLHEYTRQVKNSTGGALLFAVVGGKLSEGINFSDNLGRCVMVVGLPYPNIMSAEISEKIRYVSSRFGAEKSQQLLNNMCSKAVNQSIGRAIRHSNDYAAIILIDHRYNRPSQISLLPNWILKRFQVCDQFGQAVRTISKFFNDKKPSPSFPFPSKSTD